MNEATRRQFMNTLFAQLMTNLDGPWREDMVRIAGIILHKMADLLSQPVDDVYSAYGQFDGEDILAMRASLVESIVSLDERWVMMGITYALAGNAVLHYHLGKPAHVGSFDESIEILFMLSRISSKLQEMPNERIMKLAYDFLMAGAKAYTGENVIGIVGWMLRLLPKNTPDLDWLP